MQESLEEVGLEKDIKTMMMERFTGMAYHFMNR
jgi:truncated hemoglobin YjbI